MISLTFVFPVTALCLCVDRKNAMLVLKMNLWTSYKCRMVGMC